MADDKDLEFPSDGSVSWEDEYPWIYRIEPNSKFVRKRKARERRKDVERRRGSR